MPQSKKNEVKQQCVALNGYSTLDSLLEHDQKYDAGWYY